jgi:membrane protein implicated in regulation of membrane protease activity
MTLVRFAIVLGVLCLVVLCLGVAAFLAFLGYLVWLSGFPKSALAMWGAAVCPLALLGIVLAFLPEWCERLQPKPASIDPSPTRSQLTTPRSV